MIVEMCIKHLEKNCILFRTHLDDVTTLDGSVPTEWLLSRLFLATRGHGNGAHFFLASTITAGTSPSTLPPNLSISSSRAFHSGKSVKSSNAPGCLAR